MLKVIFFGTPPFSAQVLSYLLANGVAIQAVITKPDKPKGRSGKPLPTPVKLVAEQAVPAIPVFQPEIVSIPEFAATLEQFKADLFVVVAYGEIIKQHLLDMPSMGCINCHVSLLPKYRGAAPIQRSIMNGDPVTGVTIMHMVRKMDAGDIIAQKELAIPLNASFPEIEQNLCQIGSELLLEVIKKFESVGKVDSFPQDPEQVTLAPKIELEDCELAWNKPASQLHNLIRAVTPDPAAWCYVSVRGEKKRLRIFSSRVESLSGSPGEILQYGKQGLVVACGEGALRILEVQLEGKKVMTAHDFTCGIPQQSLSFK